MRRSLPDLEAVPRTMLWTLHCRAEGAARGQLEDPEALRIAKSFGEALRHTFGRADPAFATRARLFDTHLQAFLRQNEGVTVVSLGEGLETQRFRVTGYRRWISVDLPEVIAIRDRLFETDAAHTHVPADVSSLEWLEHLEAPSFVVAQGLFMYLPRDRVRAILQAWSSAERAALMFDVVPPWVSVLSRARVRMTARFSLPTMPWGVRAEPLRAFVAQSVPAPHHLELHDCPLPSGPMPVAGRTVAALLRTGRNPEGSREAPIGA